MVHVHLRQRLLPLIYLNPEVSSIKLYLPLLRSLVVCETPVSPSNMALVESEVDSIAELKKTLMLFQFYQICGTQLSWFLGLRDSTHLRHLTFTFHTESYEMIQQELSLDNGQTRCLKGFHLLRDMWLGIYYGASYSHMYVTVYIYIIYE